MAWRNKPPLSLEERLQRIDRAGLKKGRKPIKDAEEDEPLQSIDQRIKTILDIEEKHNRHKGTMLFFVMYDIENNKVRNQVVNYLIRSGCHRIQKSIFLADLEAEKFSQIKEDLAKVQSYYDNHDSILIVPISTDYLQAMKVIGQNINFDIITKNKNTLFF